MLVLCSDGTMYTFFGLYNFWYKKTALSDGLQAVTIQKSGCSFATTLNRSLSKGSNLAGVVGSQALTGLLLLKEPDVLQAVLHRGFEVGIYPA